MANNYVHYGPHKILVQDDEHFAALAPRIEDALQEGSPAWVEIKSSQGIKKLLISSGVPVVLTTTSAETSR